MKAAHPDLQPFVRVIDPEEPGEPAVGCVLHGAFVVTLLSPEYCTKCHGANAYVEFCPVCRADCECE